MAESGAGRAFAASMLEAGNLLKRFDPTVTPESGVKLHVSFLYLCCYTDAQHAVIHSILKNTTWPPINVTFDRAETRIDNFGTNGGPPTHYSICVFLDAPSNQRMLAWVDSVEASLQAAGVPIHIPRSAQEPFHSTLAVVNGLTFPYEAAMAQLNQLIPRGKWTGSGTPLTLTSPSLAFVSSSMPVEA